MIGAGVLIALAIVFFIWEKNKYHIVNETIADTIAKKTDSLYTVKYDSLHFDEILGTAYLENIHVEPDTVRMKNMAFEDLPFVLLDIKIKSINVTGVKTDKALMGQQMIGDSVVINDPEVTVYFVKSLRKQTNINVEAKTVYDEILGNLNLIKAGHVFINNAVVKGLAFQSKEKAFDFVDGNIQLRDVLIDSAHNRDTSRTLFCKQADLQVSSFITYNHSRPELRVSNINFQGEQNWLSLGGIQFNRFEDETSDSSRLLNAQNLRLEGLDANEFVKNKNIVVGKITCQHINLFAPLFSEIKSGPPKKPKPVDTTGFRHVYSIDMNHLSFPNVTYKTLPGSRLKLGNIGIKINNVTADEIYRVQKHPLDYSKEVEVNCSNITVSSKKGDYNYIYRNVVLNSFRKQLDIGSYIVKPLYGERAFANREKFQRDRYDVVMKGVSLEGIDMKNLIEKKILASQLRIKNLSAKIYRDLQKPLRNKSKVGRYPSQLLGKIDIPVNIEKATISNAFIEYREREALSDSTGSLTFTGATLSISNITNADDAIQKNDKLNISFGAKALGTIPIKGSFIFTLKDTSGNFTATGNLPGFDAHLLNQVAIPMALMRINTGNITSIKFNFKGDNYGAGGKMVMKYTDLKVDVLKRDSTKESGVKKKGITSLLANIIIKNDNPRNGNLREVNPHSDRDVRKSFFNLVWKTMFVGMKKTMGIPGG